MINNFIIIILLIFSSLLNSTIQHPTGFISIKQCSEEGALLKYLLHEGNSEQFILSLDNGIVVDEGAIVTENGKILSDTETYKSDQQALLKNNRDITQENPIYFDGILAVISSPGQQCYYHWLLQVLPRLKIIKESNLNFDKIYIFTDNFKNKWQKESLEIVLNNLSISKDKLLLIDKKNIVIQAKKLIVPSIAWNPSKKDFWENGLLSWFKKFFDDAFLKSEKSDFPKRIFISRSKANYRRISNETSLVESLTPKGFVCLQLEELSLFHQALYFNNAEIIIGPHGAGWSNLIFCKPKTQIIEIDHGLKGDEQRSSFKDMAKFMNCHYHPFYVDMLEQTNSPEDINAPLNQDLTVDIFEFEQFCKKLGI